MTVPRTGKGWKLAPSLVAMEAEADRIAPRRNRASDGSIGDTSHAARQSDHNPSGGYVHALDLTHDPKGGFDAHAQARQVAQNVRNGVERRIKYIISNRQIFSRKGDGWKWRPYSGINGHTHHAHFSIETSGRNDTGRWFSSTPAFPTPPVPPPFNPPAVAQEDEDDMATYIRLTQPGHKHWGRVEAVTAMHRRWVPPDEFQLFSFLQGHLVECPTAKAFNQWTANKQPIGTNPISGPV